MMGILLPCMSPLGARFYQSPWRIIRPLLGRVEMWRGGCRLNISVSASFV